MAKRGAEERKKDAEFVLSKTNEKLTAVQPSIVLLTGYLVLVQTGRNQFPDPNADREMYLLNEMLRVLIPDANERNAIIQRINQAIKKK